MLLIFVCCLDCIHLATQSLSTLAHSHTNTHTRQDSSLSEELNADSPRCVCTLGACLKMTASGSLSHPTEGEPVSCAVSTRLLGSTDLMRSAQRKINRTLFCKLALVCGFAAEQGGFLQRRVTARRSAWSWSRRVQRQCATLGGTFWFWNGLCYRRSQRCSHDRKSAGEQLLKTPL